MSFQKGDKFWSKKPKKPAMKQAKPPPKKKTKGKGKAAAAEPSEVDESQVGDALSEVKIHPLFTRHPLLLTLYLYLCISEIE